MGRARCRSCPGQADMPRRRYFGEAPTARSRISVNPKPVPQTGVTLTANPAANRLVTTTRPTGVCHSNATRPKEVLGFMFEKFSQPGAPLRNRTVDLLLTMDHQTGPVSAAEPLSRQNPSSRHRSRAHVSTHWPRFAPQNAPRNDLHFVAAEDGLRRPSTHSNVCLAYVQTRHQTAAGAGMSWIV